MTPEYTQRQNEAAKQLRRLQKRLKRRLVKQEEDLSECAQADQYRQWGELLKSHLHEIQSRQASIEVVNYFDEALPRITIPLVEGKSPQENLALLFRKATKLERAVPHIEKRLLETMEQLEHVATTLETLTAIDTEEAFLEWESSHITLIQKASPPKKTKGPKQQESSNEPIRRLSSDGIPILIGRHAKQNQQLTFSTAKGNEWWFHAQGVSGSHVIVQYRNAPLPPKTLHEAAQLAAYYSKARPQRKVDVDYTQCKHLRKIKGAEPGKVLLTHHKTLYIEIDDALIQQLLDSIEEPK